MNNLAFYAALILNRLRNERQLQEQQKSDQEHAADNQGRNKASEGEDERDILAVTVGDVAGIGF